MKKPRKSAIPLDEAKLFRAHVQDVTPLATPRRTEHERPLPQPIPEQRLRDDRQTLKDSLSPESPWDAGLETGEELCHLRNGVGEQALRRLRRGHWVIQDELDLHGLTVEEARPLLGEFLNQCARRGLRCVRIIHGKGLRSRNREPVLKRRVAVWLIQREDVLAFCQARSADGGGGAVVVLLKGVARGSTRAAR
ncbi:MAG TPA: Smr/MutS family protein [Burkholderiales bacterium]|nr:Smr/MutS family protein [Burkholderiales bacterium]